MLAAAFQNEKRRIITGIITTISMNKTSNKIFKALYRLRLSVSILPLIGLAIPANAQQSSQGNTTIFSGASMTVFSAHNFLTGGSGTQPGIVKTIRTVPLGIFKFSTNATQTAANDANHVDGYVSKIGSAAFTFPVGNGSDLRTLAISAPTTATSQVAVAWFTGNPGTVTDPTDAATHDVTSIAGSLNSISPAGFWDWVPVSGAFNGTTVTASIPDLSTFATTANLRLAGWNGTMWLDLSNAATATGNTEGSTITGVLPATGTISAIALASITTPLPVTLISFTVQKKEAGVEPASAWLQWTTSSETNSDHFEIERSQSGKNWNKIGTIGSAGESAVQIKYSFEDMKPLSSENLYRLRMIDKDGTFAYSRILSVKFEGIGTNLSVYPNPSTDRLIVPDHKTVSEIVMSNLNGNTVYKSSSFAGGSGLIDVISLAKGLYIVKVTRQNGSIATSKVVIEH
jgi:hypothetical protein